MFTIDQIKGAHAKVKSGADFPNYIQEILRLGVASYETYVEDGHSVFYGKNSFKVKSPAKYDNLHVSDKSNKSMFEKELKVHQDGKSSYLDFCNQCAALGIQKWRVNLDEMTCTYYDKAQNMILVENIPQV